jgi:polyisoprenoid-binding protein YceI
MRRHTDRTHPPPTGTWVIDPAHSNVSFVWRRLRLGTMIGRLHCLGVIHLDALPPVGDIQLQQPSGLPILAIALDPASVEPQDADLDTLLCGRNGVDVGRHRWWTLRSEGLEVLSSGNWRVTAILTANGTAGLVELGLEVDSGASDRDRLVMRGRGVLDRRAFGVAKQAAIFNPQFELELALRARRVVTDTGSQRKEQEKVNA